ncbi:MAG TPA: hypothetical protein VMY39_00620 [Planctomycetota bacterium]|nr:hypothetical protein [Planctomycetota bacterium]
MTRRFFSDDSFWNRPIAPDPAIDPRSAHFTALLSRDVNGPGFGINVRRYTIPVYEVDDATPLRRVHQRTSFHQPKYKKWGEIFSHGPGFGPEVPIPDDADPDPDGDHHLALVDWNTMRAWDMWAVGKRPDGEWESATGMTYRLDGDGVFEREWFRVRPGESIHFYGPSRASGVPAIAGLIMHDEMRAGRIRHKLAFASRVNAYLRFVWPATWTDGHLEGGIPEGAVIQLDPEIDLARFDLGPGGEVVARALQEYGAVNTDNAGGNALYAEHLCAKPGLTWEGLLDPFAISAIPASAYRVLKLGEIIAGGMTREPVK